MGRARDLANFGSNGRINGNIGVNVDPTAPLHVESPDNSDIMRMTVTGNEMWAFRGASGTGSNDYVSFGIHNNGNQAVEFHETGVVKKPNQPSFKAHGTTNQYLSTTPIEFPSISGRGGHNIGSHYNTSNYRFTAPIAGRYFFYVHVGIIRIQASTAACYPQLRVNGAAIIYSYVKMTGSMPDYCPAHLSAVVNLSASDYVDVTFVGGSNSQYYNGPGELSFQGYLLG